MANQKDINIWLEIAEEDLDSAEYSFQGKKYLWAMVMCQQAIEKILKALYVKKIGKIPEKTHNLVKLCRDTGIIEELSEENIELMEKLLFYYFGTRYPEKREKLKASLVVSDINNTMSQTKEIYLWLKNKL